jgi:hypothetical protein
MRAWMLALLLALPLGGCFYSLDGSLVNKKRDSGGDVAQFDGVADGIPDAPDGTAGEAVPDAPVGEAVTSDVVGEATDLVTEGTQTEAGLDAGADTVPTE